MRTKKTILNMITSVVANITAIFAGFIAQSLFLKILGKEYLGLNGLFSNIISFLSIAELGVGIAIIFNLYKPIANHNEKKILSLLKFYKSSYKTILCIIAFIGIIICPFLDMFVDISSVPSGINIYAVYLLFLLDACLSYVLSYKRSILYASQNNYLINIIHTLYLVAINLAQLFYLWLTKDYYGYLIIKSIFRLAENSLITITANKKFKYIKNVDEAEPIDPDTKADISKKVRGSFFHKIGAYIIFSTDNIIISKFIGLASVGLYSNYSLVFNAVRTVFSQAVKSTTASIGNLLISSDHNKKMDVFKKIRFINFWLATFSGVSILIIMESFIKIWIGEEYLLPTVTLIVLVVNYYLMLTRSTYESFKDAAGIQYEDRFVPIIESTINIVSSIILVRIMGITGVFIGTILSSMALWAFSFPKYIYKKVLNGSYFMYSLETLGYFILFTLISAFSLIISSSITLNNPYMEVLKNIAISTIVPNIIIIILFFKTNNFKYILGLLSKARKKIFNKK